MPECELSDCSRMSLHVRTQNLRFVSKGFLVHPFVPFCSLSTRVSALCQLRSSSLVSTPFFYTLPPPFLFSSFFTTLSDSHFHDDSTTNLQDPNLMTEPIKLWVYAEGRAFPVSIFSHEKIHDLKKEIFNEGASGTFVGCDPIDLTLTKVRYIMTPK